MRGFAVVSAIILSLAVGGCAHRGASSQPAARGSSAVQPAMTPTDLQAAMKKIGSGYGAMMKKLQGSDMTGAADDGKMVATTFGDVEKFWAQHKKADAVTWAQQARMYASNAAGAAAANDAAKAMAAAQNLGGACKQCHGTYREGDVQTGFRIKPGAL